MMKQIILILSLTIFFGCSSHRVNYSTSVAQEAIAQPVSTIGWTLVNSSSKNRFGNAINVYVNDSSIERDGQQVKAIWLIDDIPLHFVSNNRDGQSELFHSVYSCDNTKYVDTKDMAYSERMGNGDVVYKDFKKNEWRFEDNWVNSAFGKVKMRISVWEFLCNKKLTHEAIAQMDQAEKEIILKKKAEEKRIAEEKAAEESRKAEEQKLAQEKYWNSLTPEQRQAILDEQNQQQNNQYYYMPQQQYKIYKPKPQQVCQTLYNSWVKRWETSCRYVY